MLTRKKKHIMLKITKHISGGEKQVTPWLLHQQNKHGARNILQEAKSKKHKGLESLIYYEA